MNSIISNLTGKKVSPKFAHLDPNKGLGAGVQTGFPILNYRGKNWNLRYQGNTYQFTRPEDGSQMPYIDVIILADPDYVSKSYFGPDAWNEDSANPPICSSIRGDRPDPGVPEPQAKACVNCSHYGWTTLPNGRPGKECKDHKRLAVLLMPKVTKRLLGSPLHEPVYLKIPPASMTLLKTYGDMLMHEGFPYATVVTRIGFSSDKDKMFHMVFTAQQPLSDAEADFVLPLLDDPRTKRITGQIPTITVRETVDPPPVKSVTEDTGRVETGLLEDDSEEEESEVQAEAEAKVEIIAPPIKRGRGRPPKVAPKIVEAVAEALEDEEEAAPQPAAAFDDEGDDDLDGLDARIKNVLNTKTEKMMK
jgi:hypothetical protein